MGEKESATKTIVILGLSFFFSACATPSGVDQLPTLVQKEASQGLVPQEYLCPGTGREAPDPRLVKEIQAFLEKNAMFGGLPAGVAADLPIILNVPVQKYLRAFAAPSQSP